MDGDMPLMGLFLISVLLIYFSCVL